MRNPRLAEARLGYRAGFWFEFTGAAREIAPRDE